jgi:hypothetical protein
MNSKSKRILIALASGLLFSVTTSFCQQKDTHDTQECKKFVQAFYAWNVPASLKHGWSKALRDRRQNFSRELLILLEKDLKAQEKSPEEIVGLDFDPFLNSQDPGDRYSVGSVDIKSGRCWANVYIVVEGQRSAKAVVVPELVFEDHHWIFTNFHYGKSEYSADENLMRTLRLLANDRQKQSK